jgi:integrase
MDNLIRKKRTGLLYKRSKQGNYIPGDAKKRGTYYLQYDIGGKRFRVCLNTTVLEDAEKERERIMAPLLVADEKEAIQTLKLRLDSADDRIDENENERNPPFAIVEAWNAYVNSTNRPDSGKRTLSGYKAQFLLFSEWLREKHPTLVRLQSVTTAIAEEYAGYLLSDGAYPAGLTTKKKKPLAEGEKAEATPKKAFTSNTFNKHIRLLELVFRVLQKKARINANPWLEISRKTENKQSRRELTVQEINTICNRAAGELRLLFVLGIYTGMRLGDCCTLRWSEVDMDRVIILRVPSKMARRKNFPVHIPIHPTLFGFLNGTPKGQRQGYVLPAVAARYIKNASDVTKEIKKHFINCKIQVHKEGTGRVKDDDGKLIETGSRAVVEVGFHSLRHSFVSLSRAAGAPLAVVEAIVGHSNPAMTRHYTHVSDQAAAQAISALPALIASKECPALSEPKGFSMAEILELLKQQEPKTWRAIRDQLVARLSKAALTVAPATA